MNAFKSSNQNQEYGTAQSCEQDQSEHVMCAIGMLPFCMLKCIESDTERGNFEARDSTCNQSMMMVMEMMMMIIIITMLMRAS